MGKLSGKTALVTGGSSGIGLAIARLFVEEGAYVYITGRREGRLEAAKAEIGGSIAGLQADLTKLDELDDLFARIKSEKGSLDVVVANAGMVELQTIAEATPEHFDRTFTTNARGTYFTVSKAIPLLSKGSSIVLVASGMHLKGFPAYGAYAATKAAIRSFARTWAAELKGEGIRVNTLSPGLIETPIIASQFPDQEQADGVRAYFREIAPLGRVGEPIEMAKAALFLASSDSSYSTGIDLVADGGITSL